jgi:glycosyltransferase involved in cell wall biosynthesis
MKLTFFSNFLNHHQIPICNEFYQMFGNDFKFVSLEDVPGDRAKLGYLTTFQEPYLLESHKSDENFQEALKLGLESDVVIIGSSNEVFIKERLKKNKLTFRYSERIFKKHALLYYIHPVAMIKRFKQDTMLRRKNVYLLSSSAFAPYDYSFYLAYPKKMLKWGYFPEAITYKEEDLVKQNQIPIILWVGRLIDWKRPWVAIRLAEKLIKNQIPFEMQIIGSGPLFDDLKAYIKSNHLSQVKLLGSKTPDVVRSYYLKADIHLVTSTKEEGWGAVLNEGMNAGCVPITYYEVGAAPYLIHHLKNGFLYKAEDDLYQYTMHLCENRNLRRSIGLKAYETIHTLWNHKLAANRFVEFSQACLENKVLTYTEGPLSKAPILSKSVLNSYINSKK